MLNLSAAPLALGIPLEDFSSCALQGAKFGDICANTDKFEGSVVREMRRLDELMRNLELAAKVKHLHSMLQGALTQQSTLPMA